MPAYIPPFAREALGDHDDEEDDVDAGALGLRSGPASHRRRPSRSGRSGSEAREAEGAAARAVMEPVAEQGYSSPMEA